MIPPDTPPTTYEEKLPRPIACDSGRPRGAEHVSTTPSHVLLRSALQVELAAPASSSRNNLFEHLAISSGYDVALPIFYVPYCPEI